MIKASTVGFLASARNDKRGLARQLDPTSRWSTWPEFFFELRFAFVQRLQAQLPTMQLDRELIDVTGHFGALRFVFGQFSSNFFRVGQRARARLLRFRNGRELAALLAD